VLGPVIPVGREKKRTSGVKKGEMCDKVISLSEREMGNKWL